MEEEIREGLICWVEVGWLVWMKAVVMISEQKMLDGEVVKR